MNKLFTILRQGVRHLRNQRGASTLEYVIVLAAGVALASLLYMALSGDEVKGTLQAKIESILSGDSVATESSGENTTKEHTNGTPTGSGYSDGEEQDSTQPVSHYTDQPGAQSSPPSKKEEPSLGDKIGNFFERKWDYTKEKAGEYWDGFWSGLKEEWEYATDNPLGWWFMDDLNAGLFTGKDPETGEELGGWERVDRTISGFPIAIGKGWKWGKAGLKSGWKGIKEIDDFVIGLACAKEEGKRCNSGGNKKDPMPNSKQTYRKSFGNGSTKKLPSLNDQSYKDIKRVINSLEKDRKLPSDYSRSGKAGMAGGRKWANKGNVLPPGNYREADVGTRNKDGTRGSERIVYSDDGRYYYTSDHYDSFIEVRPEDLK